VRFEARRLRFQPRRIGAARREQGEPDDTPTPALTRAKARRALAVAQAAELLAHLPQPGEALHVVAVSRFDVADLLGCLLEKLGRCDRMVVATLGFNRRNLKALLGWLDTGAVRELVLLASIFFRSHNGELWRDTQAELRGRGQRAACCHSHAKVAALAFASGERLVIEGSANLCGNGSGRENFVLVHDAALHGWHSGWIDALVRRHEGEADADGEAEAR
jgi:hypothetical protein